MFRNELAVCYMHLFVEFVLAEEPANWGTCDAGGWCAELFQKLHRGSGLVWTTSRIYHTTLREARFEGFVRCPPVEAKSLLEAHKASVPGEEDCDLLSLKFFDKCFDKSHMVQSGSVWFHMAFDKFRCILWTGLQERVRKDSIGPAMTQTADPEPAPSERPTGKTQTAMLVLHVDVCAVCCLYLLCRMFLASAVFRFSGLYFVCRISFLLSLGKQQVFADLYLCPNNWQLLLGQVSATSSAHAAQPHCCTIVFFKTSTFQIISNRST